MRSGIAWLQSKRPFLRHGFAPGLALLAILAGTAPPVPALGQLVNLNELSEEEQRQVQIAERFQSVLQRNPRRGTALDRIYGHHVEFGTLDHFMQSLRDRVEKAPRDGTSWMLLGLFEAHRGEDANAIDAFRKAEELRSDDPLASYYLGQSLLLLGQPDEAVATFERAIERRPQRADLLEIFQQLGRLHQRAQRTAEALQVWQRLEALFPDDPRVQEQIAVTLVEEGEYSLALPRYENLAKLVRDDYRRTMFRIEAAELKIRENSRDEGLAEFERLLADLNPESWLHRDVRRRIEDVFLRSGNQDGLVTYYEKWIAAHPDDVDAMARLARFLASAARVPEATTWMEKALRLAPSRAELRKAFIDQLVDDQRYAEAIAQYELLVESNPGNADFLRDWGKLVLKNKELDPQARRAEAARIWSRILAARPDDALTTAQVADLLRQSDMNDEALALYQKAVEQAPNDPQYREYLGEFYHILKRPDEALAAWTAIAEGERHTALNVARLAEIYNSFGYLEQAVPQIAKACRLDPKDFALQLKAAEYHGRAGKFDEALGFVRAAAALAANDEQQDAVIAQRIDTFRSSRRLDDEIDALSAQVGEDPKATAEQWHLLARYCEAASRWAQATEAVDRALQIDPQSVPALSTAARIAEYSGDYARAAEMNRQLAAVDRRSRGDHLMNVARLEAQMGRAEPALEAGQELIVSAPGNTDNYEFYARLCFQLGRSEEGVDTLRKAVRINPTEPYLIMALGSALADELRTDEAIEVYWRAFERTDNLDDKTSLTMKLTDLYVQINQFDRLMERLERDRRQEDKRHEMTICLAQAHHSSGDYGTARQELESLLGQDTRDTNLLQQLSKLCEEGSDVDGAVEYQRQLVAIAPGHETEYRLATLLQSRGDRDEASDILLKLMRREEDPARRLRNLDSLLTHGAYENVISLTEPLLSEQRDDWELLYREAVAWASLDKTEEAEDRFERLLSLPVAHDELGVVAEDKFKRAQATARSNNLRGLQTQMPTRRSPLTMLAMSHQIRMAAGLDPDRSYYGGSRGPQPIWTPDAFGEARMAAYGWLMRFDQERASTEDEDSNESDSWQQRVEQLAAGAAAEDARRETLYDWMYVEQLRGNLDSIYRVTRRLAAEGGREEQQFFLSSLAMRGVDAATQQVARSGNEKPQREPLSEDDLQLMLECYEAIAGEGQTEGEASMFGGQIAYSSTGQAYAQVAGTWVPVAGFTRGSLFAGSVIEELKTAGREDLAEQLLQEQIDSAQTPQQLVGAMQMLAADERYDRVEECLPKWVEAARDDIAQTPASSTSRARSSSQVADPLAPAANLLMTWIGHLGPEEEHAKILSILGESLDVSAEMARRNRAERSRRRRSYSATPAYYGTSYSVKYGKETIRAQFDYPRPGEHVDASALMLTRAVYEILKRNDVLDDLPAHLETRLQNAAEDEKLHATLMLAYVRWWLEEREDALALLKRAGAYLNDDPAFRLEIAWLHQSMGELEDALEIVEAIVPRDQKLVQQRELMALQLAERLGDIDRARQSAERLFGLRLDNNTQLALIDQMRRLGMHEMAEAVVSRVQRRSGNSLSSMGSLMALYQSQGNADLAQQLAHTILRRTQTPLTAMTTAGRNPFRYSSQTDESQMRTQALRLLHQTGTLKDLIARLEQQIEKSPNSPRLYDELIEYYETANQRDKVGQLLAQAVATRPDAVVMRYRLAKHLESTGKLAEACDQYLEILEQKPQWISEDLYQVRRTFERASRSLDLIQAVENINLKLFSQPYYIIDLVTNLMRGRGGELNEENLDLALNLFEKVFEAFPQYRNRMVSRMYDQNLWKNERVFELGKKAILPSVSEAAAAPWFGLNEIYSYSSGGTVNAHFHRMLSGIQGSGRMSELRQVIEDRLREAPGWHAGQAMLALIDLKDNRQQQAKQRLEELVADEETLKSMPSDSCWIIGQELDQFEDTRAIALTLFETAIKKPRSMSQIQYSPAARLVQLYGEIGRKQDARDLLLQQINSDQDNPYDAQYSSYLRVENSVWAGQQLLKLDCPVDAIRLFRQLSQDPTAVAAAGQWYGNRPEYFRSQVDKGLTDALAALDSASSAEAMTQLLAVQEGRSQGAAILDLMLLVPGTAELRTRQMESPMVDLLITISKDQGTASGIRKRLAELRSQYPADLSTGITESAFLLHTEHEQVDDSLQSLLAAVADQPLEEINQGRRPNSRQRREALAQVPLWLVARECLKSQEQTEIGIALAERAREAARRQTGDQHTAAILYDWGRIALDRGDRQQAEARWSELLDIVTRRPERQAPRAGARSSLDRRLREGSARLALVSFQEDAGPQRQEGPRRTPPLTVSQFRLVMEIALAAAENGMPALSRKAVRASMLGGTPVEDLATSAAGQPVTVRSFTASSTGTPDSGLSQIETEVAESLRKVLAKWQGDAYPPQEVYQLLVPIVFPENRPAEILLYADSSKLAEAEVHSLGAVLVEWAAEARQLDDLVERIRARKENPQTQVAALVMETHAALARGALDTAQGTLTELAEVVSQGTLPPMVQLACHAALPATRRKGLAEPAYAILKAAVNLQIQAATADGNRNPGEVSLGRLISMVNRHLADEPAEVKRFFEDYLVTRQAHYSRYSGTYGQYLQWQDWAAIAEEAAKAGLPTVALDYMGRVADFSYERYSRPSTTTAMAVACREMSLLAPAEQYEAWRDWTLPIEGRQTVRLAAEFVEPVRVPPAFLHTGDLPGQVHTGDLLCNFTQLLASAQANGRLQELRDLVQPAYEQELENAASLYALILIQLGDLQAGKQVIEPLIKTLGDRLKRQSGQPTPEGWGDYLVYRGCLQSPEFASLYESRRGSLQSALRSISKTAMLARLEVDFAARAGQTRPATIQPGDDPQLDHWFPATTKETVPSGVDPWWEVQEGHIAHLTGAGSDLLYFAYPLTGEFEFTVDAYKGSWAETDVGYGGIVVEAQRYGSSTSVWSTGGHESVSHPQALARGNEYFGTVTVQVADGKMRYFLNHHLTYEEELSGTSPWIALYTSYPRATTFRSPRFTGNPTIPREVLLVNGERMEGWNTSFFGESQPRHRLMAQTPKSENDSLAYYQRQEPAEFDWRAEDGILVGRAQSHSASAQSWTYYHRPLRDRETFSYDFYYVPGQSVAHPTVGRIALLLEPEGVDEHWITRAGWDDPVLGIAEDNRVTHPGARRGDGQLPLEPGDWNRVRLTLAGRTVQVTLNDHLVYERTLEAEVDTRFGLYRGRSQSLKVRQPKLSGPWPESLTPDIRDNLLDSTKQYTAADRRLINRILQERFFQQDTAAIVAQARQLPPEQAYEKLLAWVLPSPDHAKPRLYFEFSPVDQSGEQDIVCPAYELIAAAERAGKLDELSEAINNMHPGQAHAERGSLALNCLLAMHSGDFELARHGMAQLHQFAMQGFSKQLSPADRSIEFVVAWQASQHPALHFAAFDMSRELLDKQRDGKFSANNGDWGKWVDILVGRVEGAMLRRSPDPASEPALDQWTNVPYYKPDLRAQGFRHTDWLYRPGVVQHIPGGTWGQLFFQSPLKGNFEIVAQRGLHGWREMAIAYGMHSAEPRYDYKAKRVSKVMHGSRDIDVEIQIPRRGAWLADFRIVVSGNKITTFVNDVQIHEETLSPQPDPWVVLQAHNPGNQSTVRNLRITGSPEVLDEIDLIEIAGWASWRADIYGESFSLDDSDNNNAPWRKVGDEIHGQLRESFPGAYRQSLLMYQRPMLEDGVIEFESFYLPGEFEVHPAVGRTALVVSRDGVQSHTLTGAQYDSTGLAPGNLSPIAGAAGSVELKEKDWNRYRLSLEGDRLTLAVNGADVATITLAEPSNQRFFGLFRYSNKSKCRVRNLVYRGDWLKTLPPVEHQQLARAPGLDGWGDWSEPRIFDLSEPVEKLQAAGLQPGGPEQLTAADRGTRMLLKNSEGYGSWPRFHLRELIEEDCIITLDFEDLKIAPPKEGWGCSFVLRATLEEGPGVWVESAIGMNRDGAQHLKSIRRHKPLTGQDRNDGRYLTSDVTSGRLRLIRTGPIISTYYAELGSEDFQLMEIYPVGEGPVNEITILGVASDAAAVMDVVVTRLTIQTRPPVRTASASK